MSTAFPWLNLWESAIATLNSAIGWGETWDAHLPNMWNNTGEKKKQIERDHF